MTASNVPSADAAKRTFGAFLATLTELVTTWAAYGLKVGKLALEQSAEALGKTARTLDTLATELEKKHAEAPKSDVAVDADAPHTA